MKFLLDVCAASRSMNSMLIEGEHDVMSALEASPKAPDEELLALATAEQRTIITENKDFGELVFVRRLPPPVHSSPSRDDRGGGSGGYAGVDRKSSGCHA